MMLMLLQFQGLHFENPGGVALEAFNFLIA